MRERREIPRSPDGPLFGDPGHEAPVQEVEESVDDLGPDPRMAAGERV